MQGLDQCKVRQFIFSQYAPKKIRYGINRYPNKCKRLYSVIKFHLNSDGGKEYLVGGWYIVADSSPFTWVRWAEWAGIPLEKSPALDAWMKKIKARAAVQRGLWVPEGDDQFVKLRKDPNVSDLSQAWVMKGQDELEERHGT